METKYRESLYADVAGDEVLLEAAESYAEEFSKDCEDPESVKEIVEALFLDGARWAIKNRGY